MLIMVFGAIGSQFCVENTYAFERCSFQGKISQGGQKKITSLFKNPNSVIVEELYFQNVKFASLLWNCQKNDIIIFREACPFYCCCKSSGLGKEKTCPG